MTATKIDGTAIARSIRERLGEQIKKRQESNARYKPSLKIVQGESVSHEGWRKSTDLT
jgi:methylenetetrahydrofolate dehydrogenase (NADP+)/methenyltetrahydrofolate cyclohydrolase/formyltetrahydrofolate synthetase